MGISFLSPLPLASRLFSATCKAFSDNHFAFLNFFFLGMVLITATCTMSWTSVHSSSDTLSNIIPWFYLSFLLYNSKGLCNCKVYVIPDWSSGFPYFLQFKSEFCNKEFIIWTTVSSQSWFCWQYRASPSLASKNIINLISVMYMCKVISRVVGRGYFLWPVCFIGKTLLVFALLHFILQGQTCLLLQVSLDFLCLHSSPLWWKIHLFFSVSSRRSCRSHHRTIPILQH